MTLAKVEDPNGVFKNAVVTKAAMDLLFNTAGCAVGATTAIASAGASTPMAVAGCARLIASALRFAATVIDARSKTKHVPESIVNYVTIQNECGSHRTPFAAAAAASARAPSVPPLLTPCNPTRRFVEAIDKVLEEHQKLNAGAEIGHEIAPMNRAAVNGIGRLACAVGAMSEYSTTFMVRHPTDCSARPSAFVSSHALQPCWPALAGDLRWRGHAKRGGRDRGLSGRGHQGAEE